jgi:hypothetical protein
MERICKLIPFEQLFNLALLHEGIWRRGGIVSLFLILAICGGECSVSRLSHITREQITSLDGRRVC